MDVGRNFSRFMVFRLIFGDGDCTRHRNLNEGAIAGSDKASYGWEGFGARMFAFVHGSHLRHIISFHFLPTSFRAVTALLKLAKFD